MSEHHLTQTRLDSLPLAAPLIQALNDLGFTYCTPIQAAALPLALDGKDLLGQAQTGTGKTATFLLSAMNWLIHNPAPERRRPNQPRALILAPTRELALQIHKDFTALAKYTELTAAVIYGGTGYGTQRKQLEEGVDILVGTPGRTIDYFKQHVFDLRETQVVVLDEADRMFDLGFIKDIRFLLRRTPKPDKRLSMLFSATLPWKVTELAYEHMNNPQLVAIDTEQVTAKKIEEAIYFPSNEEKLPLLIGLLRKHQPSRAIIFVNTKAVAERVVNTLQTNDYHAGALSGDVPQNKRQQLLKQFQDGELPLLVATDVAARGLHIEAVSHVINFDLPQDAEDYVHRIGRTARAGASGVALSIGCEEYSFHQPEIEEYIGHKIPYVAITDDLLPEIKTAPRVRSQRPHRKPHAAGEKTGGDAAGKRRRRRPRSKARPAAASQGE
ncbi:MAG: DEAD/DEAH box helicase [Pseudomonadota bacterium]